MSPLAQGQLRASIASSRFYHAFYNWNALLVTSTMRPLHTLGSMNKTNTSPASFRETRSDTNSAPRLNFLVEKDTAKTHGKGGSETSPALEATISNLKTVMRHHTQPVALVTAGIHNITEKQFPYREKFQAMTISSFTTVTLSKDPIVSFNIKTPSGTHDAISAQFDQIFRISILKPSRESALIAHYFTLGNAKESLKTLKYLGIPHEWPLGQPLRFPNAASAELLCKVSAQVPVHDHHLVLATVLQASMLSRDGTLCYFDRRYIRNGPSFASMQKQWVTQERTAGDIRYLVTRIQQFLQSLKPSERGQRWKDLGMDGMLKALSIPAESYNKTDLGLALKLLKRDPAMIDITEYLPSEPSTSREGSRKADFDSKHLEKEFSKKDKSSTSYESSLDGTTAPSTRGFADAAKQAIEYLYSPEWQRTGEGHPLRPSDVGRLLEAAGIPFESWHLQKIRTRMFWHSPEYTEDIEGLPLLRSRAKAIIRREFEQGTPLAAIDKMCEENVWFDQKEIFILGLNRLRGIARRLDPATKLSTESDVQDFDAESEMAEIQSVLQQSDSDAGGADTAAALQPSDVENDKIEPQPASQQSDAESEMAEIQPVAQQSNAESEIGGTHHALQQSNTETGETETQSVVQQPVAESKKAEVANV